MSYILTGTTVKRATVSTPASERLTRDAIERLGQADASLSYAILALYPQDDTAWMPHIPNYTPEQSALLAARQQIRATEARLRKMLPDPD